ARAGKRAANVARPLAATLGNVFIAASFTDPHLVGLAAVLARKTRHQTARGGGARAGTQTHGEYESGDPARFHHVDDGIACAAESGKPGRRTSPVLGELSTTMARHARGSAPCSHAGALALRARGDGGRRRTRNRTPAERGARRRRPH